MNTTEAIVSQAMAQLAAVEGRIEEGLDDGTPLDWSAILTYPQDDSARFASANGL